METINFLELKESFEARLKDDFKYELLELHYLPYAFGSGIAAYRIKGRNVKIVFDGRDNLIEFVISAPHVKYNGAEWTTVFTGTPTEFIENGIAKLNFENLNQ